MIVIGQWLSSLAVYSASASYTDDRQWRIPMITQLIPPAILLAGSLILPESPSWLILRDRRDEAAAAFRRFNGPDFDVDGAVAVLTAAIIQEQREQAGGSSWADCFRGANGRRTLIICMVYIAQQFIGVNFISGYLTYYFKLAGVDNALGMAQVAFSVQLFGNMCSWPLIDRFGRRPLVVGGMFVMTASLLVIGGISTINTKPTLKATVALMALWGWLVSRPSSFFSPSPFVRLAAVSPPPGAGSGSETPYSDLPAQYQATLGAVAYAIGGETPSPSHRQKTYSINIMSATAVSCAVLQALPYMINTDKANLGGKVCFVFFGPSVPMCLYLYFCLPEMKGRNYVELEEMFQNNVPARQFKNYVCHEAHELAEATKEVKGGAVETREVA